MDLNNYFRTLAEEHILIAHTEEKPTFFREYASARILLDTDFHNNLRKAGDNVLVSQFNDDGNLPLPMNDRFRENPIGSVYIFTRIKTEGIEAARLVAKSIRDDIFARIDHDIRENNIQRDFVINQISPVTIGRVADNFFGIVINISYSQRYKPGYDANKWVSAIS